MESRIIHSDKKYLVGMRSRTIPHDYRIWQTFMPRHKEITHVKTPGYYSVQVYEEGMRVEDFTQDTKIEKWAAIEVTQVDSLPEGMEVCILPEGKYAVFIHKGPANQFDKTAAYIYGEWLPGSGFQLDQRPHFEFMGEKYYGHEHPDSEEEVWVPVK